MIRGGPLRYVHLQAGRLEQDRVGVDRRLIGYRLDRDRKRRVDRLLGVEGDRLQHILPERGLQRQQLDVVTCTATRFRHQYPRRRGRL